VYVVFVEELDVGQEPRQEHIARTLDQAFAMIVCRCGYSYRFEPAQEQGWCTCLGSRLDAPPCGVRCVRRSTGPAHPLRGMQLTLIDVERPERSPDPIHSTCIKPRDAQYDLMRQAVDGRLKGHVALHGEAFMRARISRTAGGSKVYLEASA